MKRVYIVIAIGTVVAFFYWYTVCSVSLWYSKESAEKGLDAVRTISDALIAQVRGQTKSRDSLIGVAGYLECESQQLKTKSKNTLLLIPKFTRP